MSNYGMVALSTAALRNLVPAAFADSAHTSRSARYGFVPTSEVISGLQQAGFYPTQALQVKSRLVDRKDHAKHLLRFRRDDAPINGLVPEVVMLNSHDGSSRYHMMGGLFRFVCLNGLMIGDMYTHLSVQHQKDQVRDVIEGSFTVIEQSRKAMTRAQEMSRVLLSQDECRLLATTAHAERFGASEVANAVTIEHVLEPRRVEDTKNDLFSVMNRIQENVIRGGIHVWNKNQRTRRARRVTTREVKGIDQTVALNRTLWNAAESLMQLKSA